MQFPSPLVRGRLIRRYKRFLADVLLEDGSTVTSSCPNTGSMLGLCEPGLTIWLSRSSKKTRKNLYTWELVELQNGKIKNLVGINTSLPNLIISEAITAGLVSPLKGYTSLHREVAYGKSSRIDILLEDPRKSQAYVEVKNVHLMRKLGLAEFPDSKTERGVKHLKELTRMVKKGHRAVMIYLIQRADALAFSIAKDIDPKYAAAYSQARNAGVETFSAVCNVTTKGIVYSHLLSNLD